MKKKKEIEIILLKEDTPDYEGVSQIVRFKDRYFRTRDGEGYFSGLEELDEKEFNRLKKYKEKKQVPLIINGVCE